MNIEQEVTALLRRAHRFAVADIHLIPERNHYQLYYRLNGYLSWIQTYPWSLGERMIAHLKYLSKMDIGEKRKPQAGSCRYSWEETSVELRCSTITNFRLQESLVIRLLPIGQEVQWSQFSVADRTQLQQLQHLIKAKSGLIVFAGPVDSGKTSTIYHLLRQRYHDKPMQVITMEDPVEVAEPLFLQAEVNTAAGLDYDCLIKASLRHHPDVLVVGEIRDEVTAQMAVRAALTGHLVVTTVHAPNGSGVLERLCDLKVSRSQLCQTLKVIVSQRLICRRCPFCGDVCHQYCTHLPRQQKRMAIFEIWHGRDLEQLCQRQPLHQTHHLLRHQLTRAYAFGFVGKKIVEEYVYDT